MLNYYSFSILFVNIEYLWDSYLNYRQFKKQHEPNPSKQMQEVVDKQTFLKAQAYGRDKMKYTFVSNFYHLIIVNLTLFYSFYLYLWELSGQIISYFGYGPENEIIQSLVFFQIQTIIQTILEIPFSLYFNFVIEEKHNMNKQTLALFLTDLIKTIFLILIIGSPFLAAFVYIVQWGGESFYFYVWLMTLVFILFLQTIYPTLIQPLFNKMTPLEQGEKRDAIEALARKVNFPLNKLYVIDQSKRSAHSNAYFYGFFKSKHIVLFDTLLKQVDKDQLCSVLAHELGHWKLWHTQILFAISQINIFSILYVFSLFINSTQLFNDFGFYDSKPILVGLILFSMIFEPFNHAIAFAINFLTRQLEYDADSFAVELGYGDNLATSLIELQKGNLGEMNPDSWYSTYHYSHPPLSQRLEAIAKLLKNDQKKIH
eukprot:TRINITY_DN202_c3_g1_i1.p1 TRINITY_DN202_c3_g1~~TRINITY_DN202_c3_g1_i1.p1  ORF type:complete len:442 (-),score=163.70 TRINITY_DN202_c3_g1_i1:52-1335(-)